MTGQRLPLRLGSLLRLSWRFAPALALLAALGFVGSFVVLGALETEDTYEAQALIVASDVTISIDELPDTIEVFWKVGGVAELATTLADIGVTADQLLSDNASVRVADGTPTIVVTGRHPEPERAALIANTVARAVIDTISDAEAIGQFAVVERATEGRAELADGLPVLPLSIAAGFMALVGGLVALFLWVQPIHALADLAVVSAADLRDEVWVTPTPPIEGKVRGFAQLLEADSGRWRFVHAGWGDDLTEPVALLVAKQAPTIQVLPNPFGAAEENGDLLPDIRWKTALVVREGTPLRVLRDAELAASEELGAVVLLHPRLI